MRRLAPVIVLAGCGAFGAADESKDASAPPIPVDGGTPPPDGGGTVADADVDGGTGTGFCATRSGLLWCEDFDALTDAKAGWDGMDMSGNGNAVFDVGRYKSSPQSIRLSIPRSQKSGSYGWVSRKRPMMPWTTTRFESWVYLRKPDWQAGDVNGALMGIRFRSVDDVSICDVFLVVSPTVTALSVNVNQVFEDSVNATMTMSADKWVRVAIEIDPFDTGGAAPGVTVRMFFDGAPVAAKKVPTATPAGTVTQVYVSLGPRAINATAALDVNFDDVTFEKK